MASDLSSASIASAKSLSSGAGVPPIDKLAAYFFAAGGEEGGGGAALSADFARPFTDGGGDPSVGGGVPWACDPSCSSIRQMKPRTDRYVK
jgi:hypothetical protein